MRADGTYYDGRRSKRHAVTLRLDDDRLFVAGEGIDVAWPLAEVGLSDPLGSMQRSLYLPDGGRCDLDDRAFVRAVERRQGKRLVFRFVHRWENSLKLALTALVLTIAMVTGFIQFGIPVLAERAAVAIPPEAESTLGRETLQILDRSLLAPTGLDPERRDGLERLFAQVVATLDATERPYRIVLRRSPKIGANAFALPGGTVILTDELVALARNDEEIAAVLAHEVGHVRHRHAMRQVIQGSVVGLIVASLTGDVFSASSMAATLPTMLVDAKFSRDMERQADDVAVEYLRQRGATVEHFAAILTRLEAAFAERYGRDPGESHAAGYFSSHPATAERIARLQP